LLGLSPGNPVITIPRRISLVDNKRVTVPRLAAGTEIYPIGVIGAPWITVVIFRQIQLPEDKVQSRS